MTPTPLAGACDLVNWQDDAPESGERGKAWDEGTAVEGEVGREPWRW